MMHCGKLLFYNLFFLPMTFIAWTDQKVMQFVPVKNTTAHKNIIPFNKDFFYEIRRLFNIDVLIETGTYKGDTCEIAAQVFKQVHTIELSEELFQYVCQRFAHRSGIFPYQGDSGVLLHQIVAQTGSDQRIAILLDSHWSGGDTAKGFDVPIIRELEGIKKSGIKSCIILIDDIRCFQKQSDQSPDTYRYPELSSIIEYIKAIDDNYTCLVYGDLLLAYTDQNIVVPSIIQAMTMSRLNQGDNGMQAFAEAVIADVNDQDFYHVSWLANALDISTGYWRTHYYDFWYALALYKRGNKQDALAYMNQAAVQGFTRANYYLGLWR